MSTTTAAPALVIPLDCPTCGAVLDHVHSETPDRTAGPALITHADLNCSTCRRLYRVTVALVALTPLPDDDERVARERDEAAARRAERDAREERLRAAAADAAGGYTPAVFD